MAAYGNIIWDSYPTRIYGVNCTGNETSIFNCPLHLVSPGQSYSTCSQNDAGVICQGKDYWFTLVRENFMAKINIVIVVLGDKLNVTQIKNSLLL